MNEELTVEQPESKPAHSLVRFATRIFNRPLLIVPEKATEIMAFLGPRIMGGAPLMATAFQASMDRKPYAVSPDGIAVIDISGTLVNRSTGMEGWSGMSSYEQIGNEVMDAATDPAIRGLLLRCDSPGGEVSGAFDCASLILQARGAKPIYASVDDCACSAAYLLASAAERVFVTVTGAVGSIGVIAMHLDQSGFDEKMGLRYTTVSAGARKNDFNPHEALNKEAAGRLKEHIDHTYGLFVKAVAKARKLSVEAVRGTEAAVYMGPDGIAASLADEQGTYRDALAALTERVKTGAKQTKNSVAASASPITKEVVMETTKADETKVRADAEQVKEEVKEVPKETKPEAAAAPAAAVTKPAEVVEMKAPRCSPALVAQLVELGGGSVAMVADFITRDLSAEEIGKELVTAKAKLAETVKASSQAVSGAAMGQIEKAAQKFDDGKLSKEQTVARALKANPALYNQYLAENPAQTGQ